MLVQLYFNDNVNTQQKLSSFLSVGEKRILSILQQCSPTSFLKLKYLYVREVLSKLS